MMLSRKLHQTGATEPKLVACLKKCSQTMKIWKKRGEGEVTLLGSGGRREKRLMFALGKINARVVSEDIGEKIKNIAFTKHEQ